MNEVVPILLPALAMGLGWGIRGQFGHESGAMVPGALVGLALAVVSSREMDMSSALRLGAVGALACSLGGVMTYGQTLGLVHDAPRPATFAWGLLGVGVKGAVWIGLTGAFLGMMGSGVRYRPVEVACLVAGLAVVAAVGLLLLNRPHNPPDALPWIYFSKRLDPRPRPEYWGGLWLGLLALVAYLYFVKHDRFALTLAAWGTLGGGIGFAFGEVLQWWGAHHRPLGDAAQPWMDWWKVMEVTFGAVSGAALGVGWRLAEQGAEPMAHAEALLPLWVEAVLLVVWVAWLVPAEYGYGPANAVWGASFVAMVIPMAVVFGGTLAPVVILGPVLFWLSGDNVVRRWTQQDAWASAGGTWLGLGAATALFAAGTWWLSRIGASGAAWLSVVACAHTVLTLLWAFGGQLVTGEGSVWSRLAIGRSAVGTEVSFVLATISIAVMALLRR